MFFYKAWTVTPIVTFHSVYPVGKSDLKFLRNRCCANFFAVGSQTPVRQFNGHQSCYQKRPGDRLRAVETRFPNIFNPASPQVNPAIKKTTKLGERFPFQLRGEVFNVTNRSILPPETNFDKDRFRRLPVEQKNFPRLAQVAAKFIF